MKNHLNLWHCFFDVSLHKEEDIAEATIMDFLARLSSRLFVLFSWCKVVMVTYSAIIHISHKVYLFAKNKLPFSSQYFESLLGHAISEVLSFQIWKKKNKTPSNWDLILSYFWTEVMMKIWMFHHVVKHTSNLDFKTCFYSLCFLCVCAQVLGQRRTPYSNCRRYKWAMQSGQISVTPSCRAQAGHCTFLSDTLVLQEDFQNPFSWVGCLIDVKRQWIE